MAAGGENPWAAVLAFVEMPWLQQVFLKCAVSRRQPRSSGRRRHSQLLASRDRASLAS